MDDLAQEVFLRLLRGNDIEAIENPRSYLWRIATNVANDWRELARISRPHEHQWLNDLRIDAKDEPENTVARTILHEHVRSAVQELPQRQRDILLLHVNEGLTCKQIAELRQLTHRAVMRDLSRAYSQLRLDLDETDLTTLDF